MITQAQIITWLRSFAEALEQNKEYLTGLDAAIGDADHGINMDRGFKKVAAQLPELADKDISTILKTTGMTLISSVGGASGPLYGTLFVQAATAAASKHELNDDELGQLLQAAVEGVVRRGRARPGDKTMLDALGPAVEAFRQAAQAGSSTQEALQQAVAAAEQGMKDTIPMQAKKGRASYLGERSVGHQDPGATSAYLMLKALHGAVEARA